MPPSAMARSVSSAIAFTLHEQDAKIPAVGAQVRRLILKPALFRARRDANLRINALLEMTKVNQILKNYPTAADAEASVRA